MQLSVMVEYLQGPVRVDLLVDVEDGGDDVSPEVVQVGGQGGPPHVLPQTVGRGALQQELVTDPLLCLRLQEIENIRFC